MDNLFPSTPWNDYILEKNKEIIALDNDGDAQYHKIIEVYNEALHKIKECPDYFNRATIDSWFRSQTVLYQSNEHKRMKQKFGDNVPYISTDYMFMYTERINLSEILVGIDKNKVKKL